MRKIHFLIGLFATALFFVSCSSSDNVIDNNGGGGGSTTDVTNANKNTVSASEPKEITRLEFPKVKGGTSQVIVHSTSAYGMTYALEWDHTLKSQRWSCYEFYPSINKTGDGVKRSNFFMKDPDVPANEQPNVTGEFSGSHYLGTGSFYERGHICPSADRLYSQEANNQTFYMTNMQPQVGNLNEKIWSDMEAKVRDWASKADTLYVCKGGTIDKDEQIVDQTNSGFIVPRYFFMAILAKNSMGYKAMGFWIEHLDADQRSKGMANFVVNIDDLEQKTGIDFFCNLPDDTENKVESLSVDKVKTAWGF
jgi:endonuclease G